MANPDASADLASHGDGTGNRWRRILKTTWRGACAGAIIGSLLMLILVAGEIIKLVTSPDFKRADFELDTVWPIVRDGFAQSDVVMAVGVVVLALLSGLANAGRTSPSVSHAGTAQATNPWGTPYDADAQRERRREAARVASWRRRAFRRYLWNVVVVALFGVLFGVLFAVQGATMIFRGPHEIGALAGGIVLCATGLWVVAGCVSFVVLAFRRPPLADNPDPHGAFRPVASERPFDQRLEQYLDEQPTPAEGAHSATRSPMAFFVALLPGPRRGPKPPGYIREILLRIRRLLRGNSAS